jgi:hypothetical protein
VEGFLVSVRFVSSASSGSTGEKIEMMKSILVGAGLVVLATPTLAANILLNGSFETNGGNGQLAYNTTLSGWSVPALNGSYAFVYNAGGGGTSGTTADNGGATGQYGNVSIWGPGNGSSNGLTLSPDGGAFVASDPAFQNGAITQTVTLVAGNSYTISFDWAAAQQLGFNGPSDAGWTVSVGGATLGTVDASIASHGFSGWQTQSYTFKATSASEVVSFLGYCNPQDPGCASAVPPFALLDGVSVNGVPEPSTWAMMVLGFAGLGYAGFRSRRRTAISIA